MAKKPVTKKKTPAAKPKARRSPRAVSQKAEKMTGGVVVGGSIKVGRDREAFRVFHLHSGYFGL